VSKEISFNKLVSGWWMNGGELIPYAEGTDPHAEPKATPHISKKYRIQKKNTRQISRV